MILTAEFVSKGHPDRLCDAIVNEIVNYVVLKDKDALCGLECAVHTNKVFVDGRIAAGKDEKVIDEEKIKEIVREVYHNAGYGEGSHGDASWNPFPENLEIILDVCIELLSDDERKLRQYSDDQNVVNGYAIDSKETDYLPVEHYVALRLGQALNHNLLTSWYDRKYFGPDFKTLVQLNEKNGKYSWERLTLSVQHIRGREFRKIYDNRIWEMNFVLKGLFKNTRFSSLAEIDEEHFFLNGAGDFVQGGPEGDNGLSGKKLCIDFYGPSIPIGGGAIYGKDPHKIDVCGALRARELAVKLVKEHGYHSVFTTLAWSPGEMAPHIIEAYEIDIFGTKIPIDKSLLPAKDYFSIECINNDLKLSERKITSIKDIK